MANILEDGPLRRALREREKKQSPQEGEFPPLENLTMIVEVNPSGHGGTYIPVARWSRDHEKELEDNILRAVKATGFPGRVRVVVSY